jgi:hypothetical protein
MLKQNRLNTNKNIIFVLIILSELFFTLELFPEFMIARIILFLIILFAAYLNNKKFLLSINILLILLNGTFILEKIRIESDNKLNQAKQFLESQKINLASNKFISLNCSLYPESEIKNCIYQNSILIKSYKESELNNQKSIESNKAIQDKINNLKIEFSLMNHPNILFLILISSGLTLVGFYINTDIAKFKIDSILKKSDKRKKNNTILTEKQSLEYDRLVTANYNLSEVANRLGYKNRWSLNYARKKFIDQKNAQTKKKIIALDEIREGKKLWKS